MTPSEITKAVLSGSPVAVATIHSPRTVRNVNTKTGPRILTETKLLMGTEFAILTEWLPAGTEARNVNGGPAPGTKVVIEIRNLRTERGLIHLEGGLVTLT